MMADGAKDANPALCMSVESKKTGKGVHLEALAQPTKAAWLAGLQYVSHVSKALLISVR